MTKIAVFTGTRAEYGLLYWLLKAIQSTPPLSLQLIVSGSHLSPEFGHTVDEIKAEGFEIDAEVEMLLSSDTPVGVIKSMGVGLMGFAEALQRLAPDAAVVLGDRYEALAFSQAALLHRIPLLHLHGGEITEGAYDDPIRHAITKMAHLHFVATEESRLRVIQLGEIPSRVINVGALGLENIRRSPRLSARSLTDDLGFDFSHPYFLVTYHPVTQGDEPAEASFNAILSALREYPEHGIVFTYPNADEGGRKVIRLIDRFTAETRNRCLAVKSLGMPRYLSVAAGAQAVLGNSSSGIIEIPSLGVPTVNIGRRQKGRLAAASVLHCDPSRDGILAAIRKALTPEFRHTLEGMVNPYGDGYTSDRIVKRLIEGIPGGPKTFYDLPAVT
ncbi:MAG: UDP-N-acetylglucosamine 2-epimerase [Marinobacter sp.]|uniref:UDP-N-acetylglucosamine 2-epimerase n=1 Tax=Marinobacter sp. TaxID=50741 RepID=UPI00299D8F10|nr:UDP-N-acetylglucosamine 2-epimerase [Marinobacter sp.]MDX1754694.1 UDP-N-acetylglucosamine 2-epimerase [Marinobacter sp.]